MRSRARQLYSVFGSLGLALIVLAGWGAAPVRSASATVLITAVYYDVYADGQPDEAFRLQNVTEVPLDLAGWTVTDKEGTLTLQDTLAAGESIWIACEATAFADEFGFDADYEYCGDADPSVPDLDRSGIFALNNDGDEILLVDDAAILVDSVVWEDGNTENTGWSDPTVEPYGPTTAFANEGQVLYRMLDQSTGQPVADTDTCTGYLSHPPGLHVQKLLKSAIMLCDRQSTSSQSQHQYKNPQLL